MLDAMRFNLKYEFSSSVESCRRRGGRPLCPLPLHSQAAAPHSSPTFMDEHTVQCRSAWVLDRGFTKKVEERMAREGINGEWRNEEGG